MHSKCGSSNNKYGCLKRSVSPVNSFKNGCKTSFAVITTPLPVDAIWKNGSSCE